MFLKDIESYKAGQSVTTYAYTGHLCTQAVEKIPIEFDGSTETLTCTSSFAITHTETWLLGRIVEVYIKVKETAVGWITSAMCKKHCGLIRHNL